MFILKQIMNKQIQNKQSPDKTNSGLIQVQNKTDSGLQQI